MKDINRIVGSKMMRITEEQVQTIIAFIRNHEWDEISEEVQDVLCEMEDWYAEGGY